MKKTLLILVAILTFLIYIPSSYAGSLNIDAKSYILMDVKSGEVLCEKNSLEEKNYPASTTKIMTAIVALENSSLDTIMTASEAAVYDIGKDGMNIGIMPGEEMSLEQLLNALLIVSANETANIIAENICSTREEFIDLMNKRAIELGAKNTHFVNGSGIHHENHYTTAKDLAIIARHAMTFPEIREIIQRKDFTAKPTNKHESWPILSSSNKLLRYPEQELFRVIGMKTGYTGPAGFNLISCATDKDGMELISVVMGVSPEIKDAIFKYSLELLEYGFSNFSRKSIVEKGQVISNVKICVGADNFEDLTVITHGEIDTILPLNNFNENLCKKEYIKSDITPPINKGDVLGYLEYQKNGISQGKVDLVASRSISEVIIQQSGFMDKIKDLLDNVLFLRVVKFSVFFLIGFAIFRIILKRISKSVRRRRRYY